MSEHDDETHGEANPTLEGNLERLLADAHEPPRVPDGARARMLANVQARQTQAADATRPAPHSPPAPRSVAASSKRASAAKPIPRGTWIAAMAALVLLLWVFGVGERLVGNEPEDAAFAETAHENHEVGAKQIALADGSIALLRGGTELIEVAPRHLRLIAGEVLLDVVEATEPLLLETPKGRALVLGTRLLVRSEAEQTFAAVLQGQARLIDQAGELLLHSGEQATMAGGAPTPIAGRRLSHELAWAKDMLRDPETSDPVRRGNLVARIPAWTGQTTPSPEWPLPIRQMTVDVHVEDGHVRTTIDQTFFNPVARQLEGLYQFPLPTNAAVSRLAMYVDGVRMEAGVVTRDRGRDIYEQIVHTRRDPALLEWMQGNLFQIRLFPLPGRTEKRVLLSYTHALDELYGTGEIRVPIPAIDHAVGQVTYKIRVVGGARDRSVHPLSHAFQTTTSGDDLLAEFTATDHVIGDDIVVDLKAATKPAQVDVHRMKHDDGRRHLGVTVRPDLGELVDVSVGTPARDWVVLFDTSASRGPAELEAQRRFLIEFVDQLDSRDRLGLLAFDTTVRSFAEGLVPIDQLDRSALSTFLSQETTAGLGSSDLAAAMDHAGRELTNSAAGDDLDRAPSLLMLGDGLAHGTSADQDLGQLQSHLPAGARFVAVSFGQAYDAPLLARLTAAGEGLHMHISEGERDMSWKALELLSTLATPRLLDIEARLLDAGGQTVASATTHTSVRSLAEGERLELLAELGTNDVDPVRVEVSGRISTSASRPGDANAERWSTTLDLSTAREPAGWLPRAWARAHVAALIDLGVETNSEAITKLGLEHFLVTPTTSLLVLETEAMYSQFDVHRPSANSWAHYPSPDRIEIVREGPPTVGEGELVARVPVQILVDYYAQPVERSGGWGTRSMVDSTIGLGSLGLIGAGRGGGGTGSGYGRGSGGGFDFGLRGKRIDRDLETKSSDSRRFTSNRQQWGWGTEENQAVGSPAVPAAVDLPMASFTAGLTTGKSASYSGRGMPWPQAMNWLADVRLDDLGEVVPALFQDPFDVEREELLLDLLDEAGDATSVRGSVSPDARERIDAARSVQSNMRFGLPDGGELDIDGEGRFALIQERWGALDERVIYDGETLRADVPELGLSVVRQVGPTSPALLGRWVPWMVPPAEHLERFYVVEAIGEDRLRLQPIATAGVERPATEPRLEVQLDGSSRVVSLELWAGQYMRSKTEFAWADESLTITSVRPRASAQVLTRIAGPARRIVELGREQATGVELPLRSPASLEHALTGQTPGTPTWIAIQQQRVAVFAALADQAKLFPILDELREHAGRVLPGELALAGAGVSSTEPTLLERVLASAEATTPEGSVPAYLRAGIRSRRGDQKAMRAVAASQPGTPIGMLASYRVLLAEADKTPNAKRLAQLQGFLDAYSHPAFGFILAQRMANNWWRSERGRSDTWLALAGQDGPWTQRALHEAAGALYGVDDARAAELYERGFERARTRGEVPLMDWRVQWAIRNTIGEAGWELTWTRLRERVAKSGDPQQALAFLDSASQVGRLDEIPRVLERLDPAAIDVDSGLALYDALSGLGLIHEANAVLAQVAIQLPDDPAVLLRASHAAEQQGRLAEAASTLERALDSALTGEGLSLDELRTGFARLFELRARQARPLAGAPANHEALTQALAVAARWRAEDPDNAEIDRLSASLLWSLDRDTEAWRTLASVIDRHPQEGPSLAWLATTLEKSGQLERADEVWARAILVEPTDPSHRLRRAQNLLGREQDAAAAVLLKEISEGKWQDRFVWVVAQAKQLETVVAKPAP